jgi:hypothetical protein
MDRYADSNTPFDPTDKTPPPQAADESTPSNLRKAWDIWTSHPSNNAAMLQFGINMLSPQGSGFGGQLASGLGGAAEASTRNLAAEEELRKEQEAERIKREESAARTATAGAYVEQVKQGGKKSGGLTGQIATQKAFNAWMNKDEDPIMIAANGGMSPNPVVQALSKMHPEWNIKTKGDVLANQEAKKAAWEFYKNNLAEPNEDTEAPSSSAPQGPAGAQSPAAPGGSSFIPPAGAISGMYKGKVYYYDPVTKAPYPGQ